MPWKGGRVGFDGVKAHKKEMVREAVDELPLVTSSAENVDSAAPPSGDSESKSDSSSFVAQHKRPRLDRESLHITTVTIRNSDGTEQSPTDYPAKGKQNRRSVHGHHQQGLKQQQQQQQQQKEGLPIISYEKNKSVRIVVEKEHQGFEGPAAPNYAKRSSRSSRGDVPQDEGEDRVYWRESLPQTKTQDISNWVANQGKPVDKALQFLTSDKLKQQEEGVKVRPFVEASWQRSASSRASALLPDEPPSSSDDCQRSTSTLVNTSAPTKIGRTTSECQRGCVSVLCGVSVVVGAAVCLRLPGLLITYGPGTFLCAFFVCLLFVAVPLAYLECGLAQFSNNSAIGIWSLVPLARGIGWATVVGCLYWGATTTGLAAPWFHYLLAHNKPGILQVPSICRQNNGSEFDAVNYYRHCVYNLSSEGEGEGDSGPDLSLEWSLPTGLIAILMLASISVAGGPFLLAFISATGSLLALIGYGTQLHVALSHLTDSRVGTEIAPFLEMLTPDPNILIEPRVWLAALSQALLCLGPGVGMLLNHSANNAFRHPLKRHLWLLTTLAALTTLLVSATIICETKILSDHLQGSTRGPPFVQAEVSNSGANFTASDYYYNSSSAGRKTINPPCVLFSYNSLSPGCWTSAPPGLSAGAAFVTASHLTSFCAQAQHPPWLASFLTNLVFLGFLGAGVATACVCMHVGVVAAREARSLPPAVAALILMAVLSVVAAPMSTQAGASLIHLVDHYVLTPGLLWPPVATLIALATCHGVTKIRKDMTFMLESVVAWFWLPVWALGLPLLLLGVTVWAFCVDWRDLCVVDGPDWQLAVVWSLRIGLLVSIPVTAIIVINSQLAYGLKDKVVSSLQSSREWGDWGPKDPIEHHNWRRWREDETRSYASLERRLASKSRPLTYTHSTLSSSSSSTLAKLRAKYRGQGQHAACNL